MSVDDAPFISTLTRRGLLGLAAAGAIALPSIADRATAVPAGDEIGDWIDRHATPVRQTDPRGPLDDLMPLRRVVRNAAIVGMGESAHGTHTQFALKHRVARYLVEELGFRTIAWEESWGSGVVLDRYVTGGGTDARTAVGQAMFMLRSQAMLDLVRWMREFNRGRPEWDQVRFLGADVLELRALMFDEIERYVADVAPDRLAAAREHLVPLAMRGSPQQHLVWYKYRITEAERRALIAHARALYDLVRALPAGRSRVERDDAVQHAHAMLGCYESGSQAGGGEDVRDRYVADVVTAWRERTGHRIMYSAANVHTTASPRMVISVPRDEPVKRELAGGLLRTRYGRDYVSIGIVFDHGEVLTGWEVDGGPSVYAVPPPSESFADHVLGRSRRRNYLISLQHGGPAAVRQWLDGPATMRIVSSAHRAENDEDYSQHVDCWREGFDAILHVDEVTAASMIR